MFHLCFMEKITKKDCKMYDSIPGFNYFPIHDCPQTFQMVGTTVLKTEIIRMFSNVKGQQWL